MKSNTQAPYPKLPLRVVKTMSILADAIDIEASDRLVIASVHISDGEFNRPQASRLANLFANSPELLEAAKLFLEELQEDHPAVNPIAWKRLDAIITKCERK